MKQAIIRIGRSMLSPLMRDRATVFLLHRLKNASDGVNGHSLGFLRDAIESLRASGSCIVSLQAMVERWASGQAVDPSWVAFTIDDGFADQATIARELFVPMQCPVTIFLISGFLDGHLWPWDDQLAYTVRRSAMASATFDIGSEQVTCALGTEKDRSQTLSALRQRLKGMPNQHIYPEIRRIAQALQVDLQSTPPPAFMPMSWDEARDLESQGVDFGPHSVSHRIFSRLSADEARDEIHESWSRLQSELRRPVPILAWPTGRSTDFDSRDMALAREAGLHAAVAVNDDYTHVMTRGATESLFKLNRFSLPQRIPTVLRYASGMERARQLFAM